MNMSIPQTFEISDNEGKKNKKVVMLKSQFLFGKK